MCVIIYKPAGVKMPSRQILDACYRANSHGCGFVSSQGLFFKSLNYQDFLKQLKNVRKEDECILHFRLATHGSIKEENCHPFKDGDVYFAHNGILSINPIGDMTDSETAFKTKIMPKIQAYGIESEEVKSTIDNIIGYSKFAIMQNGAVRLYGLFTQCQGLYFSNTRFTSYIKPINLHYLSSHYRKSSYSVED